MVAIVEISGSFTGTGTSSSESMIGNFDMSLSGFGSGSVNLERSFDGWSSWVVVETFTADAEKVGRQVEHGVLYRFNCTAYTSGTIVYRLSR